METSACRWKAVLHPSDVRAIQPEPGHLPVRRLRFAYPSDMEAAWSDRLPEFAWAANSVSLIMPFAEPYFVSTVRSVIPALDGDLQVRAEEYVRQEAQHHRQHRRFNDVLGNRYNRVLLLERWMRRTYGWLADRKSVRFHLAFAAGSETIAFTLARWTEDHLSELFTGAEPVPATLFLWHLAEEVEHKSVAFDVYAAVDGSRLRYSLAAVTTFAVLAWFTVATILTLMVATGTWRSPVAWLRLPRWAFDIAFTTIPDLAASCLPGHHPDQLSDPSGLTAWLRARDAAAGPSEGTVAA